MPFPVGGCSASSARTECWRRPAAAQACSGSESKGDRPRRDRRSAPEDAAAPDWPLRRRKAVLAPRQLRPRVRRGRDHRREGRGHHPGELDGLYVRNGSNPAPATPPLFWATAWCTGCGSRAARPAGTATASSTLPDTGPDRASRRGAPGPPTTRAHVSVFVHGDGCSLRRGRLAYELSTDDLVHRGARQLRRQLTTAMTAQPQVDPVTGDMHFFATASPRRT